MSPEDALEKQRPGQETSGTRGGFERTPGTRVLFKRLRRPHSTCHLHRLHEKALFRLLVTVAVYQALVRLPSVCMYLQGRERAAGRLKDPFPVASVTRRLASGDQGEVSELNVGCERLRGGVVWSGVQDLSPVPSSGSSTESFEMVFATPATGRPEVDGNTEEDSPPASPPPPYEVVPIAGDGVVRYYTFVPGVSEGESPPPYRLPDHAPPPYTSDPPPQYDDTLLHDPWGSGRLMSFPNVRNGRSAAWRRFYRCNEPLLLAPVVVAVLLCVWLVIMVLLVTKYEWFVPMFTGGTPLENTSTTP